MGKASRDKGTRGELEIAHIFKAAGFDAERTPNSGGLQIKGDLAHNIEGIHAEVKRQETLKIPAWLRQAAEEAGAGETPIVIFRQNKRVGNVGEWHACIPLNALVELLQQVAGLEIA